MTACMAISAESEKASSQTETAILRWGGQCGRSVKQVSDALKTVASVGRTEEDMKDERRRNEAAFTMRCISRQNGFPPKIGYNVSPRLPLALIVWVLLSKI